MDLPGLLSVPRWRLLVVLAGVVLLALAGCAGPSRPTVALSLPPAIATTGEDALKPFVPTSTATAVPTLAPSATPHVTALPTATPLPTITPLPTSTLPATATAVPTPELAPTLPPPAPFVAHDLTLNGVPFGAIAAISPETAAHMRLIYQRGQELGRNPRAFSKLGDSLVLTDHYLTRFDTGHYNLGPFAVLQPALDHYAGSFSRYGVAAQVGLYADFATRPGLANGEWCSAEEHMLACEFRLHNPGVLLVRVGTNDVIAPSTFETALNRIVEYAIANGVIPVLGTKADRFEGDNRNNEIIRKVANDYRIPLWDFDLVAGTLPDRGLSGDNAHLTVYQHNDYNDPATLEHGYPASDLSALVVLDAIRTIVANP